MIISLFLYGCIVFALLIAELRENRQMQFFFKPLAAFGFIILALEFGALQSTYGKFILAGLIACAAGDIFLLARKSQKLFVAGMAAFAIGHIIYSFGFIARGVEFDGMINGRHILGGAAMMIALCLGGAVYIIQRVDKEMKLPTIIYTVVITTMCVLAVLTNHVFAFAGALLFAASDYFVGMDRFVERQKYWALFITPLYFGAQALFALSTQI